MEWNRIEGEWKQFKGNAKAQWGRLTDDDLMQIGIDLGGTKIEGIALDGSREMLRRRVAAPRGDYGATVREVVALIRAGADRQQRLARKLIRHFGLEQMALAPVGDRKVCAADRAVAEGAEDAAREAAHPGRLKLSLAPARVGVVVDRDECLGIRRVGQLGAALEVGAQRRVPRDLEVAVGGAGEEHLGARVGEEAPQVERDAQVHLGLGQPADADRAREAPAVPGIDRDAPSTERASVR